MSNYTCFTGTQVLGQFEETGPEYPRPCAGTHEKQSKISVAPHIEWDLTLVKLPSVGWVVAAFSQVLGYWGNLGKLGPNTSKSWPESKQKVIQRFRLFISHQMRPYSSVKGLWSVDWVLYIYTYFPGTLELLQFRETALEYPKSFTGSHEK